MEVSAIFDRRKQSAMREKLASISNPSNYILARIKANIFSRNENSMVCGYSRMHNRHNRSWINSICKKNYFLQMENE